MIRQRRVRGRVLGPVVTLAAAVLAVVCLVSGLSYPGFPIDVAVCAVLAATSSVAVAVTLGVRALDDSGVVYLPEATRPGSTGWSTETMTPLGGPWWSWTCRC